MSTQFMDVTNAAFHGFAPEDDLRPRLESITDDPHEVLSFAEQACVAEGSVALLTLTEIRGGSYRQLGALMAVSDDGRYCGYLSGGCIEPAVALEAIKAIRTRRDRVLKLGQGGQFVDLVLPCDGGITVVVHIVRARDVLRMALKRLQQRHPVSIAYRRSAQALFLTDKYPTGWVDDDIFVNHVRPRIRLVLKGAGPELEATAKVAISAGLEVVIVTDEMLRTKEMVAIDEDTAVVLLLHELERERLLLEMALNSRPFFIGALGSSRTHQKRLALLRNRGFTEEALKGVRGPVGLLPKARSADILALSIVTEVVASRPDGT